MSSAPHRQSSRRKMWSSILGRTCFGSSSSSHLSSPLSPDSLPLLAEKISFHPTVQPSPKPKPLPASPPRLTRWPSTSNLKTRRSILNVSNHNVAYTPPPDQRPLAASFNPKTKGQIGSTPETELTDQLSLMDSANILGAVGGVVGAGYAGATYHLQRAQGKEARRREEDVELGQRRREEVQFGISFENRQPEQPSGQEQVAVQVVEGGGGEELERRGSK
ncbi:MAG: hypothetical protein HETSPECPRED_006135 [Heterodermia speciosa]|uniref:Uncharacterized protein n=1 Tax=Heterodermia speciosa TaxID=116794 RepID=A0A8H3I3V4_9LECA|nr:MAG: hypothetical protein HETSPECPRED_006135 [Heterodermia speciosa]